MHVRWRGSCVFALTDKLHGQAERRGAAHDLLADGIHEQLRAGLVKRFLQQRVRDGLRDDGLRQHRIRSRRRTRGRVESARERGCCPSGSAGRLRGRCTVFARTPCLRTTAAHARLIPPPRASSRCFQSALVVLNGVVPHTSSCSRSNPKSAPSSSPESPISPRQAPTNPGRARKGSLI